MTQTYDISCSWIRRINIVKMTRQPKAIDSFSAIPMKLSMDFLHNTRKTFLHKRHKIAKTILRKEKGVRGIPLPDFRL